MKNCKCSTMMTNFFLINFHHFSHHWYTLRKYSCLKNTIEIQNSKSHLKEIWGNYFGQPTIFRTIFLMSSRYILSNWEAQIIKKIGMQKFFCMLTSCFVFYAKLIQHLVRLVYFYIKLWWILSLRNAYSIQDQHEDLW